ncbi:SDR family NAD(P)-dependent oxidoreductase [Bacillus sp. ISL-46]|nr:SDR family NAD(P)-dependent oxidoreductase [Bacillus sp. ISL-46]
MSLQGKTVIVTGGGRGIGAAVSKMFALRGANVVVNFLQNEEAARRIVDEVRESGGIAEAIQADIADPGSCQRLVEPKIISPEELTFWLRMPPLYLVQIHLKR